MRNKLLFVLVSAIAIGFLLPIASYAQPLGTPNLLVNAGFENGLAGWGVFPTYPDFWDVIPNPSSGGYALRDKGWVTQDWAEITQVVPYQANKKFYASVQYSTYETFLVDQDHFGGMVIQCLDAEGSTIYRFPEAKQDASRSGWQKLYVEGVTPPGTAAIRYTLFHYFRLHDNTLPPNLPPDCSFKLFDDAYLSPVKTSPQATDFDLMNGDFEDGLSYWKRSQEGYWQAESDVVHSGQYAVKNTEGSYAWLEQKRSLAGGETATASVRATGNNGCGYNSAFLELSLFDQNGNMVGLKQKVINGDWDPTSVSATMPPTIKKGTAVFAIRVFRNDPPATFYFDNATLTKSKSKGVKSMSPNGEQETIFQKNTMK